MSQKNVVKMNMLIIIDSEGEKCHYALIKNFNKFMYDYTIYNGRKHFCRYCLQAFTKAETLKFQIKDCFKINGKQSINIPKASLKFLR